MSLSGSTVTRLLKEATEWSYNQKHEGGAPNVADHSDTGHLITQKNQNNNEAWVLPRCFNTYNNPAGRPKVTKTITGIPSNMPVICIIASSNASEAEQKAQGAFGRIEAAINIHSLFTEMWIKVDGQDKSDEIKTAVVDNIDITFPNNHKVLQQIDKRLGHAAGPTKRFVSIFRYAAIGPLEEGKEHTIETYAKSPAKSEYAENAFENSVLYKVTWARTTKSRS